MLEVKGISAAYGKAIALKNVSLHVDEGEIVSLIGANGAGKTTTLRVITGMLRPQSGDVIFRGKSIIGWNHMRSLLWILFMCLKVEAYSQR